MCRSCPLAALVLFLLPPALLAQEQDLRERYGTRSLAAVPARVVYPSEQEDVAVLRLEKAVEHLAPLPVGAVSPDPGEKVYAVGSPGLGQEVLEQSISEGRPGCTAASSCPGTTFIQGVP